MRANFRPHLNVTDLSGKNPSCPLASTEPAESPDWYHRRDAGDFSAARVMFIQFLVGGRTNPFEKYANVKMDRFPRIRGENEKNIWVATCHHLVLYETKPDTALI